MNNKRTSRESQSGVVSIFIVIFSALLVTIVTVSFVGLMMRNLQQSSDADLSNSAYDSALAGVEDAKRLMLVFRSCQASGDIVSSVCTNAIDAMGNTDSSGQTQCDTIKRGLYGDTTPGSEVLVQRQQSGDARSIALNQYYTCVKIRYNRNIVPGTVKSDESKIIPLETDGVSYNKIKISWFRKAKDSDAALGFYVSSPLLLLPQKNQWVDSNPGSRGKVVPPIMRTQFIQTGNEFNLSDFDANEGLTSNTNSLFLYPASAGAANLSYVMNDVRPASTPKSPQPVLCASAAFDGGQYACSVTIDVPAPRAASSTRAASYLRLAPLYASLDVDYSIELFNGSVHVPVVGVAPEVDSTGRANDLFRRVAATVQFDNDFSYPEATLDINGVLCKNFAVTDKMGDFINSCTP